MRCLLVVLSTLFACAGFTAAQSFQRIRCHSCTSVNASQIVGGAGVDPGVFLSTIRLSTVPVTVRCRDPFDETLAMRAGAMTPICDDGLCVKINYTDVITAAQRCYSCTTLDADQLLQEVQDESWRRWLMNVRYVPKTIRCGDEFLPETALRAGARSQPCEEGICMKMWFRERGGQDHVWRSCIPNARNAIRSDCTKISSGEGDMEVCTCAGNLCNGQIRAFQPIFSGFMTIFTSLLLALILKV